jgi:uncharacterized protein YjbI with pentapeptide repeats
VGQPDDPTWAVQPPDLAGIEPNADDCADEGVDEPLELVGAHWTGARFLAHTLDQAELTDVRLDACDLSGVTASGASARRIELSGCRIRDCTWAGGMVQDATLSDCTTESWSLRFTTLQRVVISDSSLSGADLYGVTFDRVRFERCDLSGAAFDNATVRELRLVNCDLTNLTGAMSLRNAEIDLDDLPALAPSLARELGIRLR